MFPENFRAARDKVKQQRERLAITPRNRRHKKWLNIRRKRSDFQSSQGNARGFKEQARSISFGNVTCDRERRKQVKEKMPNFLTDTTRTTPPEPGMINLTPYKGNEKSNISFDTNYSRSNTILPEMSEMQPIIEIESYASVLRTLSMLPRKLECLLRTVFIIN